MVAELDALAAVGEGHDSLAFGFRHGEYVLQDGGGALAQTAAPAKHKISFKHKIRTGTRYCAHMLSKMRCGYASGIVSFVSMSWRMTTLLRPKYAVGPCGRWQSMSPAEVVTPLSEHSKKALMIENEN